MRAFRVVGLGLLAVLLTACTTIVRKERTVRADGRDTKTIAFATPKRYSEERTTPRPAWTGAAARADFVPERPVLKYDLARRREDPEAPDVSLEERAAQEIPPSYNHIVAIASAAPFQEPGKPAAPPIAPAVSTRTQQGIVLASADAGEYRVRPKIEVRYSKVRLWTDLETTFQSPSFTGLNWNRRPKTVGAGPEFAYHPDPEDEAFGVRLGMFRGDEVTNTHREGAFYAIEKTRLEAYWGSAEVRHSFNEWLFGEVGLGVFFYSLRTELESNTASFVYESASADGLFGALSVGCGVEAPWKYPLRPFIATRFWFPFRGEDPSFEWGVGQVSGGLSWRFGD